ncbi:FAD-dependent oxidoreductase [Actinomadura scrupuli]|uniref:FAD-dependent oxidoreductase n=1 Tax=Actinomadura scrupuli TaxID=559629 RepID=UPI003D99CB84
MTESREHAVVIGGSLAGLLAARVLADHFDKVTVIDRDRFPEDPAFRPGIPQARHLHVLWTKGLEIIEDLFPGIEAELLAAGVPELGIPKDVLWLTSEGWRRRFEVTRMLTFSRPLLDWTVRRRMAPRLTLLTHQEVTGLVPAGPGTQRKKVAGVEVREVGTNGTSTPLHADLVVDASGRASRAPEWLVLLGYPFPKETKVDPLLGYTSRYYAIPEGFDPGWQALYLQAEAPHSKRTGGLFPQEGGRWICSLSGAGRDYPPTSEDGFLDFAKGLRDPVLYDAIRTAEPLTPITAFRRTANHRRHYERLPSWPEGFIAVGDSVCAFNPIYGQGMSVAALQAVVLDELLSASPAGLTRAFQRRAMRCGSGAWLVATGEDFRYPGTEGAPIRPHNRIINRYVSRVVAAANVDESVCAALLDVLALRQEPPSLFRPSVLRRVLLNRTRPPADRANLLPEPGELEGARH